MFNFLKVIKREIEIIAKDRNIFTILILVPVFYVFMYGTLYWNKTEIKLPVIVVDMDRSEFSQTFIKRINAHQLIDVISVTGDLSYAKKEMDKMNIHGIVYIPHNSNNLLDTKKSITIEAFLNTTRFLVSNDINKALNETALSFASDSREIYLKSVGYNSRESETLIEPIKSDVRAMFNRNETYGDFLIPGIIALVLHQTLLIGLSENIARERQNINIIKEYKQISGKNAFTALAGKSCFYFILYLSYALFFFSTAFYVFKINLAGNALTLTLITSLMILSTIFLSIFISSFFKRKFVALIIIAFSTYPLFLISGYVFPSYAMPLPLQYFSKIFSITPYLNSYIRVTQLGAGFEDIYTEIINLLLITVSLFVFSLFRIKYLFKKIQL